MKVVEIFNSIEGEGKRIGQPCTFIRLFGCNLNCSYCDSRYACDEDEEKTYPQYKDMSIPNILEKVSIYGCKNITLTGGEPLIHKESAALIRALMGDGYCVNVETNGSILPPISSCARLFYTMDYKTKASGQSSFMKVENFKALTCLDVVKFVVGSHEDLLQAMSFYEQMKAGWEGLEPRIYVSPVWNKIKPVEIVNFIKDFKLWDWTVQVQLHKIVWSPDTKGV